MSKPIVTTSPREDIVINAEGVPLAGWFYPPPSGVPGAAVVLAHGLAGVKELHLHSFARRFQEHGLGVLVFDHRNFGGSGGEPRQEIDPWVQVHDYRHALTWLSARADVDPDRIGIWGTSLSGGHVIVTAAIDPRVRCAVSQVPASSGSTTLKRLPAEFASALLAASMADRCARAEGQPPVTVQVYPLDPNLPAAMPGDNSVGHYRSSQAESPAPAWRNDVTLRSLEQIAEYEPAEYAARVTVPTLMVVAENDTVAASDLALAAYGRLPGPKRLLLLPDAQHFDVYHGDNFEKSSMAAAQWFAEHLLPSGVPGDNNTRGLDHGSSSVSQ